MNSIFFSPWQIAARPGTARVTAILVKTQSPWETYAPYGYLHGIDTKINRIQKHEWGAGQPRETLYRAVRVVHFADATHCSPMPRPRKGGIPPSHRLIKTIAYCDHTTYWLGPNSEPLILTEPYRPSQEIETEIIKRNLTAIVLPAPGIYAGGDNWTASVLMGLPEDRGLLDAISKQFNETGWPDTGVAREMSFDEALKLSGLQAREVQHG